MDDNSARQNLDRLVREHGASYGQLSEMLGRNAAYIQQFVKRGTPRKLDEGDRRLLARFFGVSEAVLGGSVAMSASAGHRPLVVVPRLSIGASAGAGSLDDDEAAAGAIGFDPAWLRDLGSRPEHVSMIKVDGESMMPTLGDGDDILVDRNDGAMRLREGIYVLRMNDVLMVKRVVPTPVAGHFSIRSDNGLYASWDDVRAEDFTIVGRVIWVGRRVG